MELHLDLDPEHMTLDDMIFFQDFQVVGKKFTPKDLKEILTHFITNGNGERMAHDEAFTRAGQMNLLQLSEAMDRIVAATNQIGAQSVPPVNASPSSEPSGMAGLVPDGSESSSPPMSGDVIPAL